jgi:hypothetical protein
MKQQAATGRIPKINGQFLPSKGKIDLATTKSVHQFEVAYTFGKGGN